MSKPILPIAVSHTLAELATSFPGASRVFHRHGMDFCCGGKISLATACQQHGVAADTLLRELQDEHLADAGFRDWSDAALPELVEYILTQFHDPHRREVPRLLAMAQKVERVHGAKADCPHGLADLLAVVRDAMEEHMQKEEQILFPAVLSGAGRLMAPAIRVMEQEHDDHGRNLAQLRQLTDGYQPPAAACNTWRALYLGLEQLERDLMQHVHLENHVLFPRALS